MANPQIVKISNFQELTSPQSSEASPQKPFLLTLFERLKISTRSNDSPDCKHYMICIDRAVWCRVVTQ
jgi:hypothetical protein